MHLGQWLSDAARPREVSRRLAIVRESATGMRARVLAGLRRGRWITRKEFEQWSHECPGVDPIHHFQALEACWPYLRTTPQKLLDVGPSPVPWLKTLRHFAGNRHELSGCRLGVKHDAPIVADGFTMSEIELDPWSPLATPGLARTVSGTDYSLITAVNMVDRIYHPAPLLTAAGDALRSGGVLVLTAENIGARANLLRLLAGDGVMPDLDALIDPSAAARPLVRRYGWRELVNAGLDAGFTPVTHGFYDDLQMRIAEDATSCALEEVAGPLVPDPEQFKSHFYLVLRKTTMFFSPRIKSYMVRRAPRASLRFLKDRVAKFRKAQRRD